MRREDLKLVLERWNLPKNFQTALLNCHENVCTIYIDMDVNTVSFDFFDFCTNDSFLFLNILSSEGIVRPGYFAYLCFNYVSNLTWLTYTVPTMPNLTDLLCSEGIVDLVRLLGLVEM